jgi:hypothetical protein
MQILEDDMIALMKRRVWDIAGCNSAIKVWEKTKQKTKASHHLIQLLRRVSDSYSVLLLFDVLVFVKVYLNKKRIPLKSFTDYVKLYFKEHPELPIAFERITDSNGRRRWEVAVTVITIQINHIWFIRHRIMSSLKNEIG